MVFSKLVTRSIWPACGSCFSSSVSQEVIAPSLLQSWSVITWLLSMQVLFSTTRRALQVHLHLDFWEWSSWDLLISIGICCPWECVLLALLSFQGFLLAQFMCIPILMKQSTSSDCIHLDPILQIFFAVGVVLTMTWVRTYLYDQANLFSVLSG